jgi:hypothetical protein
MSRWHFLYSMKIKFKVIKFQRQLSDYAVINNKTQVPRGELKFLNLLIIYFLRIIVFTLVFGIIITSGSSRD